MATAQVSMTGARLSYVVVEQEGTVRRHVHKWKKGGLGISVIDVEEPAGFLVYFPRGHVIRIKDKKELHHYKLDREPQIVNMQGLSDRNSPLGKLMFAQDESVRRTAMYDLEKQVIALAEVKSGKIIITRDVNDLVDDMEDA